MKLTLLLTFATILATGCVQGRTSSGSPTPTESSSRGEACDREAIELAEPDIDVLVVGTTVPIEPPWFEDGDPTTGRGFESAVVYAVAEELGFAADEVAWLIVDRERMLSPGPKEFDLAVDQLTAREAGPNVDLSTGYLELPTLLLVEPDPQTTTPPSSLSHLRIAAVEDSAAADHVEAELGDGNVVLVPDESAGALGLQTREFDALAADPRQAADTPLQGLAVLGRLPALEYSRHLHFVIERGNAILGCIDAALLALGESGLLDEIAREWLGETVVAPVLPSLADG